jgi:hypothetical protein
MKNDENNGKYGKWQGMMGKMTRDDKEKIISNFQC